MVLRFLVAAPLFAAVQMLFVTLWPSSPPQGHLLGDSVRAVSGGILFAFLFVAVIMKRILTYEVVVSDDCITLRGAFLSPRSVRRD
jgi:predicted anti-sigma-YlaC factor YlaD